MDDRSYEKNFLSNVIFKLVYPTLSEYGLEKVKEFRELIKNEFPVLEEHKIISVEHTFEKTKEINAKTTEVPKYMFFNKNKKRIISFESDNIIVEFTEYAHFEDFLDIVKLTLNALFQIYQTFIATRLGLRYINQIKFEETDPFVWENLLNKSLVDSLDFIPNKRDISRYITSIELNKEDYRLRFQFGIPNSLYPSTILKKEFVLDYDCFTHESLESKEEIIEKVNNFHEAILSMFEASIDEGLRELMGVAEDG